MLNKIQELTIPRIDDLHTHQRQEDLMQDTLPFLYQGGAGRVLVMPNLKPPLTKVDKILKYQKELKTLEPRIDYIMTLYLTPSVKIEEIKKAKENGVNNVKLYPTGVTTGSQDGVDNIEKLYPVLEAMQELDMIFNIHGEVPSDFENDICIMNAEQMFLPILDKILKNFPKLRVVLEHLTTKDAVKYVKEGPDTLAGTITAHHLDLVVDHWAGRNHNYCKPVAKFPSDRNSIREAAISGNPKFFLGSDSAPHKKNMKETACGCAGIYTAPYLAGYYADVFERLDGLDKLENFATKFGADFYGLERQVEKITLIKKEVSIEREIGGVVPFKAGKKIGWKVLQS